MAFKKLTLALSKRVGAFVIDRAPHRPFVIKK